MAYKYVPIPKEETYELIKRAQAGEETAKALVMEQNTGLVKKLALKFTSPEYEADDLIQIGYMGLLKAIYKFDPAYDVMFSTYAVPMIVGEIKRFFRDNGKIKASRSLKSDIYALKRAEEELEKRTGQAPKVSALADCLGVMPERVCEIMEAAGALNSVVSLDNQLVEEEYDSRYAQASPEHSLEKIMIKKEIENLEPKERQVILLRYYKDMTQQEIAQRMGISQVQVSRIEKKALGRIREKIIE